MTRAKNSRTSQRASAGNGPLWRQERKLATTAAVISSLSSSRRNTSARKSRSTCRGVEPGKRPEGAVGSEAPVGDEHVDVWVEIEQLARGLDKPNGPWDHGAPSK